MRRLAIIGPDQQRLEWLERIGQTRDFEVEPLLAREKVRFAAGFDVDALLDEARRHLAQLHVDGITTFWDFPSSCLVPILAAERGLPHAPLRAVVNVEHKYWSRLTQQRVAPDDTPAFAAVDVFADDAGALPPLDYPFWLKPVKAASGHLGFRIDSDGDLRAAITRLRAEIHRLGAPFEAVMERVDDLPEEVAARGGCAAIAESILEGEQCTLEGHVHDGEIQVHGIFDIHRAADGSTFTHYTYPSRRSEAARARMHAIASELLREIGYDHAAFNIEFFVDEDAGRARVLEINSRISQEHSYLMKWVDDTTNLEVMAEAALGDEPDIEVRSGRARVAGKFFVRRDEDAILAAVPDDERIAALERRFAPCVIELVAQPGDRLSALRDQEPHSYVVAYVHLGADDLEELYDTHAQVMEQLDLRFEPVD